MMRRGYDAAVRIAVMAHSRGVRVSDEEPFPQVLFSLASVSQASGFHVQTQRNPHANSVVSVVQVNGFRIVIQWIPHCDAVRVGGAATVSGRRAKGRAQVRLVQGEVFYFFIMGA